MGRVQIMFGGILSRNFEFCKFCQEIKTNSTWRKRHKLSDKNSWKPGAMS